MIPMEWIELTDENQSELLASFVGKKIVAITREPDSKDEFSDSNNTFTFDFDDGRRLELMACGREPSGIVAHLTKVPKRC